MDRTSRLVTCLCILSSLSGCYTSMGSSRHAAENLLLELSTMGVKDFFRDDYREMEAAWAKAESLRRQKHVAEAEGYYEAAFEKGQAIKEKHRRLQVLLDDSLEKALSPQARPQMAHASAPAESPAPAPPVATPTPATAPSSLAHALAPTPTPSQLHKEAPAPASTDVPAQAPAQARAVPAAPAPVRVADLDVAHPALVQSAALVPSQPDTSVQHAVRTGVKPPVQQRQTTAAQAEARPATPPADGEDVLVGGVSYYRVKKGDTLRLLAATFGTNRENLARYNNLDPHETLHAGQTLMVNNRHIIPKKMHDGLLINIPDRTLYLFRQGTLVTSLPVAVGKGTKSNAAPTWQTPTGAFRIVAKVKDPAWRVPPSIQREMEASGREPVATVPPGPRNPLGKYAMRTSLPGILIHSTTAPASIYGFSSHGCIRVRPERMEELFKSVSVNTNGQIIYQPVKVAVTPDRRVFVEVHQDVYGKMRDPEEEVREAIRRHGVDTGIDWRKLEKVVKEKTGLAEDVSL